MACYREKTYEFTSGFLDELVDHAFILTMENSKRSYMENYIKNPPCSKLTVQFNKGYNCPGKDLVRKRSDEDLKHATRNIFYKILHSDIKRALILEDDFETSQDVDVHLPHILDFFASQNPKVYNLGPVAFGFAIPIKDHIYALSAGGAHAYIVTKEYIQTFINKYDKFDMVDNFANINGGVWFYKVPIIYQTFPDTENMTNWGLSKMISNIARAWFRELSLHENTSNFRTLFDMHKKRVHIGWVLLGIFLVWIVVSCIVIHVRGITMQ